MSRSLLVKTIKGETFRIDVAEECTMGDVKAKITEVRGEDPATQLLICGGKTLKDDDPLATSVAAGGFLVLMVKKKRVTPAAPPTSAPAAAAAAPAPALAAPAPASAAAAAVAPAAAAAAPTPLPPPPAAAGAGAGAGAGAAASAGGGDGLAIDPASVEMLTAMGFPEDQATAALRAAFNDVSRAASYLMEGIPDDVMAAGAGSGGGGRGAGDRQQGGDAMMMAGDDGEGGGAAGLAEALMEMQGGEGNPLNFMRFHPQFDQLRSLVRETPAMLPQVLQGLASQSPELIERINQHPDDFLRLMNEPPDAEGQAMMEMGPAGFMEGMEEDEEDGGEQGDSAAAGGVGVGVGVAGRDGGQGGSVTVELTEDENAAVENLMAMVPGVGRDQVIEAFIACDKNAEMAANLLFENAL